MLLSLFSEADLEEHIVSSPHEFCFVFLFKFLPFHVCVWCACVCMHVYM